MARPKKRTAPEANTDTKQNDLLEALRFLSLITKAEGAPNETHISLSNKRAMAFNGVLSAGQIIEEDLLSCPHNTTLINALSKCGEYISYTQMNQHKLAIKSGKFKAIVPCLDPYTFETTIPDDPTVQINDEIKTAIEAVNPLASENGQRVVTASILINGGSTIASDGKIIFEYWHGLNLPIIAIPKKLAEALVNTKKKLRSFGYSQSSATFYFEDDSWIKTQLYAEPWPDVSGILNRPCNPFPLPVDFYNGLSAVLPFSPDGYIRFEPNLMCSHSSNDAGATYEVAGLPRGLKCIGKQLMMLKPYIETIDFLADGPNGKCIMWFGKKYRGIIAGVR